MNKKIIAFGTFDIFHLGHQDFFKQAKKLGDYLVVVIARDVNVEKIKGGLPLNDELNRASKIKKFNLVDEVILGNKKDKYKVLKQQQPDMICLGYDQKVNTIELQKKLKEYKLSKVKVIKLKAFKPEIYKSSLLKKQMDN